MKTEDFRIISLDTETSSNSPDTGTILSIGLVDYESKLTFYSEVRHESLMVNPQAMATNKIDITKVNNLRNPTLENLDRMIVDWLIPLGERQPIPLGLNVASFDLTFIKRYLTRTAARLGYRAIDINSLIYTGAAQDSSSFNKVRYPIMQEAERKTRTYYKEYKQHHALSDAIFACFCFELLSGVIFHDNHISPKK